MSESVGVHFSRDAEGTLLAVITKTRQLLGDESIINVMSGQSAEDLYYALTREKANDEN